MAKKNVPTNDEVEIVAPDMEKVSDDTASSESEKKTKKDKNLKDSKDIKDSKDTKDAKNSKIKDKKPKKEKKSLKKRIVEMWSELKKVSKPSFGKVVKNTCVVIAIVAICTVLLYGVDSLFGLIYKLLINGTI